MTRNIYLLGTHGWHRHLHWQENRGHLPFHSQHGCAKRPTKGISRKYDYILYIHIYTRIHICI